MDSDTAREEWVRELEQFTDRNAGRRTVLEVDGAEFGAQEQERDYPLRGVAYDPRDGRLEIMLGDETGTSRHLTHTVGDVKEVDVLTGEDGRDQALRVEHDGGTQTLLRLIG
ncbi:MAG: DUF5335 family protein [Longimicrobiales bacterium]